MSVRENRRGNPLSYSLSSLCGWISYGGLIGLILSFVFTSPVLNWRTALISSAIVAFSCTALWAFGFDHKTLGIFSSITCTFIVSGVNPNSPAWAIYTVALLVGISFTFWVLRRILDRGGLTVSSLDLSVLIVGAFFLVSAVALRLYNPNFDGTKTLLRVLGSVLIYFPATRNVGPADRRPLLWSIILAFPAAMLVRTIQFLLIIPYEPTPR